MHALGGRNLDLIDHPLGLTSLAFTERYAPSFRGKRQEAMNAYRRLFKGEREQTQLRVETPRLVKSLRSESPEGQVVKFILSVPGARRGGEPDHAGALSALETESVLIPMIGRRGIRTYTLCVSSQVGCAMGCGFCETAQMGLIRNLTSAEIVAQWWAATHEIGIRPDNIVFMGMGEPMDNIEAVIGAISVLKDDNGPAQTLSKITVSTVGRIDGIKRLGEQVRQPGWHRLGLAVSLNAPSDTVRNDIMPINRAMPMDELREAVLAWPIFGGRKICFEYVLIPGVNDCRVHARDLAAWLAPFREPLIGMVNVIPYNPRRDSPWAAPSEAQVDAFLAWLVEEGVYCKRRRTKGRDMMGACGQLGNENIRRRRVVPAALTIGSTRSEQTIR